MNNQKVQLRDILESIAKAKGLELLKSLKSPRRWSELREVARGDNKSLTNRMNEFIELGLVEPVLLKDSPKGSKAYVLTDFGRFVLEKLEEIEEYPKR
ncbi:MULTISPECIES: winged helix-turn-helix transcriptional regulator [unclassified Archaeoglobus]|jgi:DNA-binding HxlR family transcriptional regulator|uniref:winged helix-turn-helix transcriptional regulator n=1 Tax=unclassified Archaeoglobus TaxID=2643606 RepID=UPI0025BC771B|nr:MULTISPECIES: winged helix-turn-helix transcriptional regulator [unclassified Archaeoglobus]